MILGAALGDLRWQVHLISVEYGAEMLRARLGEIAAGAAALLGRALPDRIIDQLHIHVDQLGAGYAVPTPSSVAAAGTIARSEALMLEQVHVAKTFAGLLDLVRTGAIPADEPACILHSGGTPTLFV